MSSKIDTHELDDSVKARHGSAISALMYLMTGIRPDIAFASRTSSRFLSGPHRIIKWRAPARLSTHQKNTGHSRLPVAKER